MQVDASRMREVFERQNTVLKQLASRLDNAEDQLQEARELIKELARPQHATVYAAATASPSGQNRDTSPVRGKARGERAASSPPPPSSSSVKADAPASKAKPGRALSPSSKVHPQVASPSEDEDKKGAVAEGKPPAKHGRSFCYSQFTDTPCAALRCVWPS